MGRYRDQKWNFDGTEGDEDIWAWIALKDAPISTGERERLIAGVKGPQPCRACGELVCLPETDPERHPRCPLGGL